MKEENTIQKITKVSLMINTNGGFWLKIKANILTFFLKPFIVIKVK